jgi:hypothetical protein
MARPLQIPFARASDGAGRRSHQVEEFVRVFKTALGLAHQFPAEPLWELAERSLEVRGQLPGVPTGRPAGHTVALDEQHAFRTLPQQEERRRDSRDPGPDDHDIGSRVAAERLRPSVRLELGDPRRAVRPIRVEARVARRSERLSHKCNILTLCCCSDTTKVSCVLGSNHAFERNHRTSC